MRQLESVLNESMGDVIETKIVDLSAAVDGRIQWLHRCLEMGSQNLENGEACRPQERTRERGAGAGAGRMVAPQLIGGSALGGGCWCCCGGGGGSTRGGGGSRDGEIRGAAG